jgi:hypothetical protein
MQSLFPQLRACRYTVADLASFLLDPERTAAAFMDTEFSGATLTFACVRAGVCYVSHLGEGRAVLGCGKPSAGLAAKGAGLGPGGTAPRVPKAPMGLRRFPFGGKCEAVALTCDHRPNQPEERERVLASGGRVFGVSVCAFVFAYKWLLSKESQVFCFPSEHHFNSIDSGLIS